LYRNLLANRVKSTNKVFARIPILRKEKVAIIKLRRLGYQQAHIAKAFSRSTSTINKILSIAVSRGILAKDDMRKYRPLERLARTTRLWFKLVKWMPTWNEWIISEEGEPP